VLTPLIGWYVNYIFQENSLLEFEIFICRIVGIEAITTFALRRFAGNLKRLAPSDKTVDALQFGVKDLLIWTTAVAGFIAIGQVVTGSETSMADPIDSLLITILAMATCMAIPTVVNVWALFGRNVTLPKCLVVATSVFVSVAVQFGLFPSNRLFFTGITLVNQVLVIVLIVALRKQGYRFVKRS
jgi:hypothetical protein